MRPIDELTVAELLELRDLNMLCWIEAGRENNAYADAHRGEAFAVPHDCGEYFDLALAIRHELEKRGAA